MARKLAGLLLFLVTFFSAPSHALPDTPAAIAEFLSQKGAQELLKVYCDFRSRPEFQSSVEQMRALQKDNAGIDPAFLQRTLRGYEAARKAQQGLVDESKRYYFLRRHERFPEDLCRVPSGSPPQKSPADMQLEACQLTSVLAVQKELLADLKKSGGSPPMAATFEQSIDTTRKQISALDTEFRRSAGHGPDLEECEQPVKPVALSPEVTRERFKEGCCYLAKVGALGHYFVGAIATTVDGASSYQALGECYTPGCDEELERLQKAHRSGTLEQIVSQAHGAPKCTKDYGTFQKALFLARRQIDPAERLFGDLQDGLGFAMVPLTCGYSKPCLQAALRAWEILGRELH